MNTQRIGWVFALCCTLGLSSRAFASTRELPYALKPVHGTKLPVVGEGLALEFELIPAPGLRLGKIDLARSEGITAGTHTRSLTKAGNVRLRIEMIPTRVDGSLELLIEVDGVEYAEVLELADLLPGELRRPLPGERIIETVGAATAATMWRPEPSFAITASQVAGKYDLHAQGRLLYWRPVSATDMTNILVGVDGADVVLIDEDGFDNVLAITTTDANGNWEVTVPWNLDPTDAFPDLAVRYDSGNSLTQVGPNSITTRYSWRTPVVEDVGGTEFDSGDYVIVGTRAQVAHILSTVVRGYRWYNLHGIYPNPTAVHWPDPEWSYYTSWNQTIHMLAAHSWSERTITHELGHHYVNQFSSSRGSSYCNGVCDDPGNCGHCAFCPENIYDAWGEGIADFIGMASVDVLALLYSPTPVSLRRDSWEQYQACGDSNALGFSFPSYIEGGIAVVLRDLYDDDEDEDTAWTTGLRDRLQIPTLDILSVADAFTGDSSDEFMLDLKNFIAGSPAYDQQDLEDFWELTQMNGWELDTVGPTKPGSVTSNSHSIGVSNPNNFPTMLWNASTDDLSGVDHYLVSFSPGGPGVPTVDIGDVTSYTPPTPLLAGSWWFNIRAIDRAGHPSSVDNSFGPIVIATPSPVNLQPYWAEFWEQPALPSQGSLAGTPAEPTTLSGGIQSTYFHFAFYNNSVSGLAAPFWHTKVEIDGKQKALKVWPAQSIAGGQTFFDVNVGPYTVAGGRHMFVCSADGNGTLAESVEIDNWHGQQWIWNPQYLYAGIVQNFSAPPDRFGGFNKVAGFWLNRDGVSFINSGWWNAVFLDHDNPSSNFDLSLHPALTSASDGFAGSYGYSGRPAGRLDAVFSNRNNVGTATTYYDVGVLNANDSPYTYRLKHIVSTQDVYGSSYTLNWSGQDRMELREFWVGPDQVGPLSPEIQLDDPAQGPVTMMLLDESFALGDIHDHAAITTTDASGFAQLNLDLTTSGYYCLVFYRDPSAFTKVGELGIDVALAPTKTNLLAYEAPGWAAPLVPRPATDGTPGSVPLPTSLPGDAAGTFLNVAMRNDSPIDAVGSVRIGVECDGQPLYWVQPSQLDAGSDFLFNSTSAQFVPAGRHTLVMTCDSLDDFTESSEGDNVYGAQYVWSPGVVPFGPAIARAAPRDPFGGVEGITVSILEETGEPGLDGGGILIDPIVWPNCDGVRTPQLLPSGNDGYWGGLAVLPGSASNVDLRLHDVATSATSGFAEDLASSGWGVGQSDFVFVNRNWTPQSTFDGGVLGVSGTEPYFVEAIRSTFLAGNPYGPYGDFDIPADHIVNLHEVYLDPDVYVIGLDNLTPAVRLGFSVYGPLNTSGQPYFGKSDTLAESALSWIDLPGPLQYLTVQIPEGSSAFYCIAVWKGESGGLQLDSSYRLEFHSGATATPEIPSRELSLRVYPNPFNPRTTVWVRLPSESAVQLELFDLRGARIRSLPLGTLPAGSHSIELDGVDQRGAALASGRYLLRLTAGGREIQQPITLLK